jgi:hypothetical protein
MANIPGNHQPPAPAMNDGLPDHSAPPPKGDVAIPEFLDRRKANGVIEPSYVDLVGG